MIININRFALTAAAVAILATPLMMPAQAAGGSACTAAAQSASAASDAIVASSSPDEAAALMTCIFPLMPEKSFRAAALSAAEGVKNAELSKFIIETASGLLLRSSRLRVVPDGVSSGSTPVTPPSNGGSGPGTPASQS